MFNHISDFLTLRTLLVICAILVSGTLAPSQAYAQASTTGVPVVQVSAQDGGSLIALDLPVVSAAGSAAVVAATAAVSLPTAPYHGYVLPMHFVTLAVPEGTTPALQIQQVSARELPEGIAPSAPLLPPVLDWEPAPGAPATALQLPAAPIFIVREGRIHGQRFVVVAVSPVYQEKGVVKVASSLQAFAAGATPLQDAMRASAAGATATATEVVTTPINEAALKNSYKLIVAKPGLQEVLYSELGLASAPGAMLLSFNGQPVAVEKGADRLRFYVQSVGDRWNLTAVYWLILEQGPAIEPVTAPVPAAPAGLAYARGQWVDNKLYDSVYPGPDRDHWFNMTMRATPRMTETQIVSVSLPVTMTLPVRSEPSTFTANVTAFISPPNCSAGDPGYRLEAQMASGASVLDTQIQAWNPAPGCLLQPSSAVSFTTTANLDTVQLRLLPNAAYGTGIFLDSMAWERPVDLNFAGAAKNGADFWTGAGAATFNMTNLPERWQLYNVTTLSGVQLVANGGGGVAQFNQAASAPPSHYALANLDALQKPTVQANSPADFGNVLAANAIYIGPASFADELAPLVTHRQQQGYTPLFVDVQKIFDVYAYGHFSAVAIRNFLRHQTDWQNPAHHLAVVLVGDGSYDPYNYEGKNDPANNDAYRVPPYMADVDPFIREAPCEQCFAQLNGDDPRTGDNGTGNGGSWFAADIWLGRFPVRSEQEVSNVVAKLVSYETNGDINDIWRSRHVFLADNYIKAVDSANNADIDTAGDFATIADTIIQLLPASLKPQRIYLDAAPSRRVVATNSGAPVPAPGKPGYYLTEARKLQEPGRMSNLDTANANAIASLGGGAGLVVFNGHSNHWQYARMEGKPDPTWLFYTNDVDLLNNFDKLFIGLSMTCYTAQFAKPAANGTLDEVLFRRSEGGAAAMWGSSGLSVVHGHDQLQKGFMKRLWSAPAGSLRLGELTEAGYTELLTNGGDCCQDALMTFLLLGDPLTPARVAANAGLYLPNIKNK